MDLRSRASIPRITSRGDINPSSSSEDEGAKASCGKQTSTVPKGAKMKISESISKSLKSFPHGPAKDVGNTNVFTDFSILNDEKITPQRKVTVMKSSLKQTGTSTTLAQCEDTTEETLSVTPNITYSIPRQENIFSRKDILESKELSASTVKSQEDVKPERTTPERTRTSASLFSSPLDHRASTAPEKISTPPSKNLRMTQTRTSKALMSMTGRVVSQSKEPSYTISSLTKGESHKIPAYPSSFRTKAAASSEFGIHIQPVFSSPLTRSAARASKRFAAPPSKNLRETPERVSKCVSQYGKGEQAVFASPISRKLKDKLYSSSSTSDKSSLVKMRRAVSCGSISSSSAMPRITTTEGAHSLEGDCSTVTGTGLFPLEDQSIDWRKKLAETVESSQECPPEAQAYPMPTNRSKFSTSSSVQIISSDEDIDAQEKYRYLETTSESSSASSSHLSQQQKVQLNDGPLNLVKKAQVIKTLPSTHQTSLGATIMFTGLSVQDSTHPHNEKSPVKCPTNETAQKTSALTILSSQAELKVLPDDNSRVSSHSPTTLSDGGTKLDESREKISETTEGTIVGLSRNLPPVRVTYPRYSRYDLGREVERTMRPNFLSPKSTPLGMDTAFWRDLSRIAESTTQTASTSESLQPQDESQVEECTLNTSAGHPSPLQATPEEEVQILEDLVKFATFRVNTEKVLPLCNHIETSCKDLDDTCSQMRVASLTISNTYPHMEQWCNLLVGMYYYYNERIKTCLKEVKSLATDCNSAEQVHTILRLKIQKMLGHIEDVCSYGITLADACDKTFNCLHEVECFGQQVELPEMYAEHMKTVFEPLNIASRNFRSIIQELRDYAAALQKVLPKEGVEYLDTSSVQTG